MTTAIAPRELRPYQNEAVEAVTAHWGRDVRRVAVVLPTGSGKSTVIAKLAVTAHRLGLDVVMMAHRGELLEQMADAVAAVDPSLPAVGIVRAERDETHAPIIAATLQTLTSGNRLARVGRRQVILWDEVHHAGAASWSKVLDDLGGYQQGTYFCGFTATLRREDGKALRTVIEAVAYEKNLKWAIEENYLAPLRGLTVKIPNLDLKDIKTTAGDFQQNELAEVMEASTDTIVDAIMNNAAGRRPIIFAASVDAAHMIAHSLSTRLPGMSAEAVDGSMSLDARAPIYARYRSGETRALVTVMILTEGADFPMCDCAVIARPTQSQTLYSQMVGRALRTYPDKADALVLDLVGTTRVLKLVTVSDLDAGVPVKIVDPDGDELPPDDDEDVTEPGTAPPDKIIRQGPVDMVEIDLLGESSTRVLWLATYGKVPFLPAGDIVVFLWPQGDDTYQPGWIRTKAPRGGGWIDDAAHDVAMARDIALDWLVDQDHRIPSRNQSWRKDAPPSDAQINYARTLGVDEPETMNKARLSDEISIALASRVLDK